MDGRMAGCMDRQLPDSPPCGISSKVEHEKDF